MTVTEMEPEVQSDVDAIEEEKQIRAGGQSMIQIKVGNEYYDAVKAHRCRVCQSPHRMFIEAEIIKGTGYKGIADHIAGWNTGLFDAPDARAMAYHMREGHAPIKAIQHRKVMERVAEDAGRDISDGMDDLVDKVVLATAVVNRAHERLVAGDLEPTLQDANAASRFLAEYERTHSQEGLTGDMWREAMFAYMEVLGAEIAPEREDAVRRALENHPTLKALREFQERLAIEQGDVVEGHVVEG